MKKLQLLIICILTITLTSGCGITLFTSNKSSEAKNYLKEKYNLKPKLKSWDCVSYDDTVDNCSKNSIYIFDNGIEVYYDYESNEFQDNYQNEQIIKDAEEYFNNYISSFGDIRLSRGETTSKVTFNTNMKGNSYFHNYYDGDINKFVSEGSLIPKLSAAYVITSKAGYKSILNNIKDKTNELFPKNYINFFFISESLYNDTIIPDTDNYDCYAKLVNGKVYEQNFITLVGSIIISSNIESITLADGDVTTLNENNIIGTTNEEQDVIQTYDNYKDVFNEMLQDTANRNNTKYIPANPIGSALYKIKFTNNLKEKIMRSDTDKLDVYMKFNTTSKVFMYESSTSKNGFGVQLNPNGEKYKYVKIQDGDYIWFE